MIFSFKKYSIRSKLIFMQLLTTFAVLMFTFGFFSVYDAKEGGKLLIKNLAATAHIISANSASGLTFQDSAAVAQVLYSLEADDDIANAWVYDNAGNLFAAYSKQGYENYTFPKTDTVCAKSMSGCLFSRSGALLHGFLIISKSIMAGDEYMGTLSLRLNERRYHDLMVQGLFVAFVVLIIAMIGALLLAYLSQRAISRPILTLVEAGQKVIDTKDYAIRVKKESEDEIGTLVNSFNNVMTQVQVRENERDKAYDSLRESEKKYRTLFDNMNDGFSFHKCIVNDKDEPVDYVFLEVNTAFERFTGLKAKDIIGKPVTEVIPGVEQLEPNLIKLYGETAMKGENLHFEEYFEPFNRWYAITAYQPQKGYFCTMFKDVTEKKKSEALAKQHQEKLIQTDKMATLGILVSGVAHEINNPNNFMLLNSNNLSDIWQDLKPHMDRYAETHGDFLVAGLPYSEIRSDVEMLLGGIIEGTERIRKIVESLKNFARKDPGSMDEKVQVNTIIESALIILSNMIKKCTDNLKVTYAKNLPRVSGNAQQIEQVIINLISNACQATNNKRSPVEILTWFDTQKEQVVVSIQDKGKGISKENLKHIMDPFFTTKRDTGGTGLGLSISYTIIKDHGGELSIESEEGTGTIANIYLPTTT